MKLEYYSIRDVKSSRFMNPFSAVNKELAERVIYLQLNDDHSSLVTAFPADFELYFIGTFDDSTGVIEPVKPVFISNILDILNRFRRAEVKKDE